MSTEGNDGQADVVINPYRNQESIKHRKFISHLGIAFIDLKCVEKKFMRPPRTILRKICGQINYGTLNGIFGPKRCGKTKLLECLSGRNIGGLDPESKIYVNPDIPHRMIYLENKIFNNVLLSLTVNEILEYAFRFRDPTIDGDKRNSVIKELIQNIDLYDACDQLLSDCVLEDQLRALVAMSLSTIDKPNMMFIEEPFADLDNVGIENFVGLMKRLSRIYSIAVVFSTSYILDSDVLSIFDKLYVLSRGGLCVYEGSVEHMSLFLRESDVIIKSRIQTPIEKLIKIASKPDEVTIRLANRVLSTREDILHFAQKYGQLMQYGLSIPVSTVNIYNILDLFNRCLMHKYRYYWKSIIIQYWSLVSYILLLIMTFDYGIGLPDSCYTKTNDEVYARLIIIDDQQLNGSSSSAYQLFNGQDHVITIYGQHLVEQNLKFLFVITTTLTLFHLLVCVVSLNEEIIVACNEHRNGLVNINSFILVKNTADMIIPFINTISCSSISYFLLFPKTDSGYFLQDWRFWSYFLSQLFSVACAQSLGLVLSVISIFNQRLSNMITLFSCTILIIFGGYLIPFNNTETWLKTISHVSFIKHSFELTLISWYGMERCDGHNNSGSFVLEEFSIENEQQFYVLNLILLATHYIFYCFLFWIVLVHHVNKNIIIVHQQLGNRQQTPSAPEMVDKEKYLQQQQQQPTTPPPLPLANGPEHQEWENESLPKKF